MSLTPERKEVLLSRFVRNRRAVDEETSRAKHVLEPRHFPTPLSYKEDADRWDADDAYIASLIRADIERSAQMTMDHSLRHEIFGDVSRERVKTTQHGASGADPQKSHDSDPSSLCKPPRTALTTPAPIPPGLLTANAGERSNARPAIPSELSNPSGPVLT